MATAQQYLQLAYDQACQRLSELDTVPISSRARMTYTDASTGQSFDWNGYRQHLLDQIKELGGGNGSTGLIAKAAGPFEVFG